MELRCEEKAATTNGVVMVTLDEGTLSVLNFQSSHIKSISNSIVVNTQSQILYGFMTHDSLYFSSWGTSHTDAREMGNRALGFLATPTLSSMKKPWNLMIGYSFDFFRILLISLGHDGI